MTLIELQKVLGDRITLAKDAQLDEETRAREAEYSMIISSLAKQMINNADVILRTEKLQAEGKLNGANITRLVGERE